MSEVFSHLSEQELEHLMKRYYEKEKVTDLISEYNLQIKRGEITKHFPPEVLEENCCYCNINLIRSRCSREYKWWRNTPGHCPSCGHKDGGSCVCKNCSDLELLHLETEKQFKQMFVDKWLNIEQHEKINLEDLSLTDKIFLGALLREGISEDYTYIKPIGSFVNRLTPTHELRSEIIEKLEAIKAIVIHPDSDFESIEITSYNEGIYEYYPYQVKWSLNITSNELSNSQLIELIMNPSDLDNSQTDEVFQLWKTIALHESIEYFKYSVIRIFGVDYEIGEKTKTVLRELTTDYSVAQICSILYSATNNALRYRVEKGVSVKHAANSIIGNAQSYGEKAKINNWNIQNYYRNKACPESALSKFFFERVIKIGYEGFSEVPRIDKLQK